MRIFLMPLFVTGVNACVCGWWSIYEHASLRKTLIMFLPPGFCPLLARSSFINLSPPYSCPNPSLSPQSDQDMRSQETAGIQDRSGWREWNGGNMIKANWTHICAFSRTDACCQLVHYCTLPLSDIWVTRQIIITNSQWSIQRLSRWVTNYAWSYLYL